MPEREKVGETPTAASARAAELVVIVGAVQQSGLRAEGGAEQVALLYTIRGADAGQAKEEVAYVVRQVGAVLGGAGAGVFCAVTEDPLRRRRRKRRDLRGGRDCRILKGNL